MKEINYGLETSNLKQVRRTVQFRDFPLDLRFPFSVNLWTLETLIQPQKTVSGGARPVSRSFRNAEVIRSKGNERVDIVGQQGRCQF